MKRAFIILLLCACYTPALFSQPATKRSPTSISIGASGYNGIVGLNLDQLLIRQEKWNIGIRVGLPFYNVFNQNTFPETGGKGVSAGLNFLFGNNKAHLDVSANFSLHEETFGSYIDPEKGLVKSLGAFVGFRYQKPQGGFFLKAGAAPTVLIRSTWISQFYPLPLAEIGFTIPNGREPIVTNNQDRSNKNNSKRAPETFKPRLNIQAFIGRGFGHLGDPDHYVTSGQAGNYSSGYYSSIPYSSIVPSIWLEWQFQRHLALAGGLDFHVKYFKVNWFTSTDPRLDPYSTYAGGKTTVNTANLRLPVWLKYSLDGRFRAGFMAGPYFDLEIVHNVQGQYNIQDINGVQSFTVDNSNLDEFPHEDFNPTPIRLGAGAGMDLTYDIREQHQLSFRVYGGHDLTQTFKTPRGGIKWLNFQLGYGYRLK